MTETIPGPRAFPGLGNLLDLWNDRDLPLRGLERVAETYGPIYQATLKGQRRIFTSSAALLEELTDEKRFVKLPPGTLTEGPGPKGLFAAHNEDPDWSQAHNILTPSFSPLSVLDMFDDMKDVAKQLVLSWARRGPENRILLTDDFTRLTLDTIALCTMAYRFNSFYQESMHPFVEAMVGVLTENTQRVMRPGVLNKILFRNEAKHVERKAFLRKVGLGIVEDRRANPNGKKDVLNTMIYGRDPTTGKVMRDELISEQMVTFLIAGHETTSGLLSFAFLNLLKTPQAYRRAQLEVDEIVGAGSLEIGHLKKLKYTNAVLRETARLNPTVPMISKKINPSIAHTVVTLDQGKYRVDPHDQIVILIGKSQRDPKVWGEDADQFRPERMLDDEFDSVLNEHSGAWKPFGSGRRACIGRSFAWQEAMLATAMILQNFDVRLDDPQYELRLKQNLTIKPEGLHVRVAPRKGLDVAKIDDQIHSNSAPNGLLRISKGSEKALLTAKTAPGESMTILYGSNTGTCQALAQRLASDALMRGFDPQVMDMDGGAQLLPQAALVILITASYEGEPPDNAKRFIEWLQISKEGATSGVKYAVFGCGHRDWSRTFQRIPKLADEHMARCGGDRIIPMGFTDAAKGNVYGDFEDWLDDHLWVNLRSSADTTSKEDAAMQVDISTQARASRLRHDVGVATVRENKILTADGEPSKYHMEINLPTDCTYECGDYLAILPLNPDFEVKRIMAYFSLPWDAVITLKTSGASTIPINTPFSVFDVLRSYVELSHPATKKSIKICVKYAEDPKDRMYLENLSSEVVRFDIEVTRKRVSLFDLLTHYASVKVPFGEFLALLPPLHVRQYSISSSPLARTGTCTITYGVIKAKSLSDPAMNFQGVSGTYLQSLQKGDSIQISVRPSAKKTFRLPLDMEQTPLLMFAAGTGVAPFRGFLQHRAVQLQMNPARRPARAMLFLGCRSSTQDRLYAEEIDRWVEEGVVEVKYAFSNDMEASCGCRHVPERMQREAEDIVILWRAGARVYVCGTRDFAFGVREAAKTIALTVQESEGETDELRKLEMERRFRAALEERVASDVFD